MKTINKRANDPPTMQRSKKDMDNSKRHDPVDREDVKSLIFAMIDTAKAQKASAETALRALGILVIGLPSAQAKPAKWEKVKMDGAGWPAWRCSACKDCHFTDPENLDKYYFCPKCGSYTGGIVE